MWWCVRPRIRNHSMTKARAESSLALNSGHDTMRRGLELRAHQFENCPNAWDVNTSNSYVTLQLLGWSFPLSSPLGMSKVGVSLKPAFPLKSWQSAANSKQITWKIQKRTNHKIEQISKQPSSGVDFWQLFLVDRALFNLSEIDFRQVKKVFIWFRQPMLA